MSLRVDLPASARRHCRCASLLARQARPETAEAGYLAGLAAECAVKATTENIPCLRRDEVFYAHFPELRRLILDHASGRGTERLVRLLGSDRGFMGGWTVRMRYAENQSVSAVHLAQWLADAGAAVALMEAA